MRRSALFAASLAAFSLAAGCSRKKATQPTIDVAAVTRRNIVVTAQATGTVEPIDTVAVKSQASGLIMVMPVDVGSQVKPGDLLAQIDTRTLKNDYNRAAAAQSAARATLTVDSVALQRANALYTQKVITADEHESAVISEANARSQLTAAQTTLQTAAQNLEYATVRAEVAGTVISKTSSIGTVVSSAISTYGGGSTILTIADLTRVRMRAMVNETDVGNVTTGMPVTVTVDAFPNRQFAGTVERVEPQATVLNSVTMFPVLVSLQNVDKALLPGMNGEVVIVTQQRRNVLAVPNDAIRTARDLTAAASALGINPDSVMAMARASRPARRNTDSSAAGSTAPRDTTRASGTRDSTRRGRRGDSAGTAGSTGTASSANGGGAGVGTGGGTGGTGPQFVFVKNGTSWTPRMVRIGVSDFDYSEVISGLQEGDQVALLGAALIQAQRDAQSDRIRSMTGNGLPGTGTAAGGSTRGGGGGRTGAVNSSGGTSGGTSGGSTRSTTSGGSSGGSAPPPPPPQ